MRDLPPSSNEKAPPRAAQPYLDWALATRFSYLRKGDWIPLLIEFRAEAATEPEKALRRARPPAPSDEAVVQKANARNGDEQLNALEQFATRRWLADDPRALDDKFIIPELFTKPPALLRNAPDFNFCVGLIRRDLDVVRALINSDGWNRTIVRLELGPPIDFASKSPPAPPSPGRLQLRYGHRHRFRLAAIRVSSVAPRHASGAQSIGFVRRSAARRHRLRVHPLRRPVRRARSGRVCHRRHRSGHRVRELEFLHRWSTAHRVPVATERARHGGTPSRPDNVVHAGIRTRQGRDPECCRRRPDSWRWRGLGVSEVWRTDLRCRCR